MKVLPSLIILSCNLGSGDGVPVTAPSLPGVTNAEYGDYALASQESLVPNPKMDVWGPRVGLTLLAKYHLTGDRDALSSIRPMLDDYLAALKRDAAANGYLQSFEGAYLCGLYLEEMKARGDLTEDDQARFRDIFVTLATYLASWDVPSRFSRGSLHRPQGEAAARLLAAHYCPDQASAADWQAYGGAVWNDFWNYRDVAMSSVGYTDLVVTTVAITAHLLRKTELWTDPGMKPFWDRMLQEVNPDGSVAPYGASSGWSSSIGTRILALELAARYTGDGRYRWAARSMFDYLKASAHIEGHWTVYVQAVEPIALSAILADGALPAQAPNPMSVILEQKKVVRYLDPSIAKTHFLEYGPLDCGLAMTDRSMPTKAVLRSSWDPQGMSLLVELFPRHDPLNPTAILGFQRAGSHFAMMVSAKHLSRENKVEIEDPMKMATYLGVKSNPADRVLPIGWDGMETEVYDFSRGASAIYLRVGVSHYLGYEADEERTILFVKDRFALVRDRLTVAEAFPAAVGPRWNTLEIPASGPDWFDSRFPVMPALAQGSSVAYYDNGSEAMLCRFAPLSGAALEIEDHAVERDPETDFLLLPKSLYYRWRGTTTAGEILPFAFLLLPHDSTRDPSALSASALFLRADAEVTALCIKGTADEEWTVFNERGNLALNGEGMVKDLRTDARSLYLRWANGGVQAQWSLGMSYLEVNGKKLR
jgi:hypothetical protein